MPKQAKSQRPSGTLKDRTAARIAEDFTRRSAEEIFIPLLWTWPLRLERSRSRDSLLGNVGNTAQVRERHRQLEDEYGDRDNEDQATYPDRRRLLSGSVARLKRHAEEQEKPALLQTVFTILLQAREQTQQASLARFKLLADRERRIEPDLKTSGDLIAALQARRKCLSRSEPMANRSERVAHINELLALENLPSEGPKLPQGRGTNMAATWARHALTAAGVPKGLPGFHQDLLRRKCVKVPKNLHDAFLMATGIISYGSPRQA